MRPPPPTAQEVRVQMASQTQASQQNRRLAQQMANRPAVQAALGNRQAAMPQQQIKVGVHDGEILLVHISHGFYVSAVQVF